MGRTRLCLEPGITCVEQMESRYGALRTRADESRGLLADELLRTVGSPPCQASRTVRIGNATRTGNRTGESGFSEGHAGTDGRNALPVSQSRYCIEQRSESTSTIQGRPTRAGAQQKPG